MKTSKNTLLLLIFSLFILLGTGCSVHRHSPQYHKKGMIISSRPSGKMPPGQMKKMMGEKSAKAYSPGHNKSASIHGNGPDKSRDYGKNKPHKYNKGNKRR
ncbi:MAG: hypothetical protein ACM3PR_10720 [Bacteroidales bacterium]